MIKTAMSKPIILIPARMAAQRLPNKPLADICGEPMILHIVRRANEANIGEVCVAAGDSEIVEAVSNCGFKAVLTDPALPSGTDRCVEVLKMLDGDYDCVINLQGDMPNVSPESIRLSYEALMASDEADCATIIHPCSPKEAQNPNQVKALLALEGTAKFNRCLYFSRQAIPYGTNNFWGHIGLYAWRPASMLKFAQLKPTPLEISEKLEQLRALENNMVIVAGKIKSPPISVDSPADLELARKVMAQ